MSNQPTTTLERIGETIAHLLACGFGIFVTLYGVNMVNKAASEVRIGLASSDWARTTGVIEASHAVQAKGRRGPVAVPHVAYRYVVGERVFRSNQLDASAGFEGDTHAVLAAYPLHARVTVYYDRTTRISLLVPGVAPFGWVDLVVSLGIALFGLGVLVLCVTSFLYKRNRYLERKSCRPGSSSEGRLAQEVARRRAALSRRE